MSPFGSVSGGRQVWWCRTKQSVWHVLRPTCAGRACSSPRLCHHVPHRLLFPAPLIHRPAPDTLPEGLTCRPESPRPNTLSPPNLSGLTQKLLETSSAGLSTICAFHAPGAASAATAARTTSPSAWKQRTGRREQVERQRQRRQRAQLQRELCELHVHARVAPCRHGTDSARAEAAYLAFS